MIITCQKLKGYILLLFLCVGFILGGMCSSKIAQKQVLCNKMTCHFIAQYLLLCAKRNGASFISFGVIRAEVSVILLCLLGILCNCPRVSLLYRLYEHMAATNLLAGNLNV